MARNSTRRLAPTLILISELHNLAYITHEPHSRILTKAFQTIPIPPIRIRISAPISECSDPSSNKPSAIRQLKSIVKAIDTFQKELGRRHT